jgi:hypothetical protein
MLPNSATDDAAIALALEKYREVFPDRVDDLDDDVAKDRRRAALGAVYALQCRSLKLKPWEWPPCWADNPYLPSDDVQEQAAAAVLRRMFRHGVSRYHPDPLAAIETAEKREKRRRRSAPSRAVVPDSMHDA